jgi:hypothetical protein
VQTDTCGTDNILQGALFNHGLAASAQIANWYQQRLAMIADQPLLNTNHLHSPDTFHQSA